MWPVLLSKDLIVKAKDFRAKSKAKVFCAKARVRVLKAKDFKTSQNIFRICLDETSIPMHFF